MLENVYNQSKLIVVSIEEHGPYLKVNIKQTSIPLIVVTIEEHSEGRGSGGLICIEVCL